MTWIHASVRAAQRRRILVCVLAYLVVAALLAVQRSYFEEFFQGPFEVRAADLDAIPDLMRAPHSFVRMAVSGIRPLGVDEYSVEKRYGVEVRRSVDATFYRLTAGKRMLLFRTAGTGAHPIVEGELKPIPSDLERSLRELAVLPDAYYPFYLDERSFRASGYRQLVAFAVILLFAFRIAVTARRYASDPGSHPASVRMSGWEDPDAAALQVQAELPRALPLPGGWQITEHFLVKKTLFRFDVLRCSDLLCGYKQMTGNLLRLRVGQRFVAELFWRDGRAPIPGDERWVDHVLELMAQRAPWAVFGSWKELRPAVHKDLEGLARVVDERRAQAESLEARAGVRP